VSARLAPGRPRAAQEAELIEAARTRPHTRVGRVLAGWMPAAVGEAVLGALGLADATCGRLTREQRTRLLERLDAWPLPVSGSRGWNAAEVTAGGVPLEEVDTATMASRRCPDLFLAGEILDVEGRLGGFNFQWAWSSAWVAASGLARAAGGGQSGGGAGGKARRAGEPDAPL
jgi:predicted flavoprotein YhiN